MGATHQGINKANLNYLLKLSALLYTVPFMQDASCKPIIHAVQHDPLGRLP